MRDKNVTEVGQTCEEHSENREIENVQSCRKEDNTISEPSQYLSYQVYLIMGVYSLWQ